MATSSTVRYQVVMEEYRPIVRELSHSKAKSLKSLRKPSPGAVTNIK